MDWIKLLQSAISLKQGGLLLLYTLAAVSCLVLILSLVYIIKRFGWLLSKSEPFVFLELTFPKDTSQSSYSTEQPASTDIYSGTKRAILWRLQEQKRKESGISL